MNPQAIVERVLDTFDSLGVPYMLSGSFATNLYVTPRATADADFVVVLDRVSINDVARALGPDFKLDPQMAFETNTSTMRHVFECPGSRFAVELFLLSDDPFDQERFRRRKAIQVWNRVVSTASPEDIVIMKLRWLARSRRPKDEQDVLNLLESQGDVLDWTYIQSWCERHGTNNLLADLRHQVDRG